MFGPSPSGHSSARSVHHQYSSSVSPFHANTGTPAGLSGVPPGPTTTAAAAWSWVEKMLQLAQRTRAPSATSVSMSTAVCTVMCSDPEIRAPRSGCWSAYSRRVAMRPGISCSASSISLRPNSARDRSATLKSVSASSMPVSVCTAVVVMRSPAGSRWLAPRRRTRRARSPGAGSGRTFGSLRRRTSGPAGAGASPARRPAIRQWARARDARWEPPASARSQPGGRVPGGAVRRSRYPPAQGHARSAADAGFAAAGARPVRTGDSPRPSGRGHRPMRSM